jgi:hypothetical protein
MLVLLLVPFLLLGLCAVAASLVGGRADRYMEAHQASHLHHLPAQHSTLSGEDVSAPAIRASG